MKEELRDPATPASCALPAAHRSPGERPPRMGGPIRRNSADRHRRRRRDTRSPAGQRHHGPAGHRAGLRRADRARPAAAATTRTGRVVDSDVADGLGVETPQKRALPRRHAVDRRGRRLYVHHHPRSGPRAPLRGLYTPISRVEATDDETVRFTLTAPYAPLLKYADMGIVSKAAVRSEE